MRIPFFEKFRSGNMLTRFTTDVRIFGTYRYGFDEPFDVSFYHSVYNSFYVIYFCLFVNIFSYPNYNFEYIITLLTKKFEDAVILGICC